MGTSVFAANVLTVLLERGLHIIAVYTQPDSRSGRGRIMQPSAVKQRAKDNHLAVYQPKRIDKDSIHHLSTLQADIVFVIAYGQILPRNFLNAPRYGCVNAHASILPRWRGAAPIERAILAGDNETGMSLMQMEEGLDTGPVHATTTLQITPQTTAAQIYNDCVSIAADQFCQLLAALPNRLDPVIQSTHGVSYAYKITAADRKISWDAPAIIVMRSIQAFSPQPAAWTTLSGIRVKIAAAQFFPNNQPAAPGYIHIENDAIIVDCGKDAVELLRIQIAGKRIMTATQFIQLYKNTYTAIRQFE